MKRKRENHAPGEALRHVLYEIQMLFESVQRRLVKQPQPGFEMSSMVETFVVHARCLEEFFCDRKTNNYMKPHHFVKGFPVPLERHTDLGRMNSEIAHLTYNRTHEREKKGWDYLKTVQPLAVLIFNFLTAVRSDSVQMGYGKNAQTTDRLIKLAKEFSSERKTLPIVGTTATDSPVIVMCPSTSSSSGAVMES